MQTTQQITPTDADRKEAIKTVRIALKTRRHFRATPGLLAALDEIEAKIKEGN